VVADCAQEGRWKEGEATNRLDSKSRTFQYGIDSRFRIQPKVVWITDASYPWVPSTGESTEDAYFQANYTIRSNQPDHLTKGFDGVRKVTEQIDVKHNVVAMLGKIGFLDHRLLDIDTKGLRSDARCYTIGLHPRYLITTCFGDSEKFTGTTTDFEETPTRPESRHPIETKFGGQGVVGV
jgi:hypothetical protein